MIMIMINVGIKVKGMKRQLMNKNQFKIKLFKQVKHVNYKKKNIPYVLQIIISLYSYTVHSDKVPYFSIRSLRMRATGWPF